MSDNNVNSTDTLTLDAVVAANREFRAQLRSYRRELTACKVAEEMGGMWISKPTAASIERAIGLEIHIPRMLTTDIARSVGYRIRVKCARRAIALKRAILARPEARMKALARGAR